MRGTNLCSFVPIFDFHLIFFCRLLDAWLIVYSDEISFPYTCELEFPATKEVSE